MRILLTGVGAPGTPGTIKALRENPANESVYIIGIDKDKDAAGKFFCDQFFRLPDANAKSYLHILSGLCDVNKIDIIVPQTTKEIMVLSKVKNKLYPEQLKIMIDRYSLISMYNSKHTLLSMCEKLGLPHTKYLTVNSKSELASACVILGYPTNDVVIKPSIGNGSRGVRIISDKSTSFKKFVNEKPNGLYITLPELLNVFKYSIKSVSFLITEYLPGKEYTVDVLNIPGERRIITRIRNKIRSGISFITEIVKNEEIETQINMLLDTYPLNGVFGFQFKENEDGIPHIIECNPRIQGSMIASFAAGINIIWASIEYTIYGKLKTKLKSKTNPIKFYRYWGGVYESEKKIEKI